MPAKDIRVIDVHLTVGGLSLSVANIGAPLLAGLLAAKRGSTTLLGFCLAFSVAAFLWCLLRVQEPRCQEK